MKARAILAAITSLTLAACEVVPVAGPPQPTGPVATTDVIWKENTPAAIRGADRQECELAAIGATPDMSATEIRARADSIDLNVRKRFVDRCMANKGYTVTVGRVCTPADSGQGTFVLGRGLDTLPPLSRVRCFDPAAGGFVVV